MFLLVVCCLFHMHVRSTVQEIEVMMQRVVSHSLSASSAFILSYHQHTVSLTKCKRYRNKSQTER